MLLDLRNKKISEMNAYKDKETDRKVSDIANLLKMMDTHGKLPKRAAALEGEAPAGNWKIIGIQYLLTFYLFIYFLKK